MTHAPASQRGFVLILVLWVLALLSVLAAGIAAQTRVEGSIVRNRLTLAQVRADADAGVMLAIYALFNPDPQNPWPKDGTARSVRYDGRDILVAIEDEGGKININLAPPLLIAGLLDEMGIEPDRRAAIVNAILARRQAVEANATANGSFNGSLPYGANWTNLPFAATSELRGLSGFSRKNYDRIRPFVTVFSQTATVNPLTASRGVLLALPGVGQQDVDELLAARADPSRGLSAGLLELVTQRPYLASGGLQAVTIIAKAKHAGGGSFTRRAVISTVSLTQLQPIGVLRWDQVIEPDADASEGR